MARIVFAGELGADDGHLNRTLSIAECLRADGHSTLFIARDLIAANSLLTPRGLPFVPTPRFAPQPLSAHRPANYAEFLAELGYSDRQALRARVAAWLNLFDRTDVIVVDHAPTALIAARILQRPTLLLGTGFALPPQQEPLPPFRPWAPSPIATLRRSGTAVLEHINAVVREFGGRPANRLADLFADVPALLTTFSELDHYGPRPQLTFVGPTDLNDAGEHESWHSSALPHIFAHLRTDMQSFGTVLAALREVTSGLPAEVICVIPDASSDLQRRLRDGPLRIFSKAPNLRALLRNAHAVVSDGGAGLIAQSVSAGVPMLAIPHGLEQSLGARRLAAIGAGIVIDTCPTIAELREKLQALVSNTSYRRIAQRLAQRYSSFDATLASKQAASIIARHVRSSEQKLSSVGRLVSSGEEPRGKRQILYAWELGTNSGHLERGLAVAQGLRRRGHEVTFVVRDLNLAQRLLSANGFKYLPCPGTALRQPQHPTVNFSDLLLTCGFDDAAALSARVHAWTHLLRELCPDTIVIDHAPTAQLAAYIGNLPSVLVDSGFCTPPLANPFPSLQPRRPITTQQLLSADQRVLARMNEVAREFGAEPLSHPSQLFARSPQIITTFRELDPYSARVSGTHVGPVMNATVYARTQWRTTGAVRVFAYLRPFVKGLDALFQALQACGAEVKCVLPGVSESAMKQYRGPHFEIFTAPIELDALLKEADVVVSYGSAGLIAQSLLAGVPLLLLADILEQIINSLRVVDLGAGIAVLEDRNQSTLAAAIRELTSQDRFRAAARSFAAKYRGREQGACDEIVAAIEQSFITDRHCSVTVRP